MKWHVCLTHKISSPLDFRKSIEY